MAIDKEIKKRIKEEWLNAFSQLSAFEQNKFYKIIGCCVFGMELIKLPHSEEYRPHFVIYSLWGKDIKTCLDAPLLMMQLYNKKDLQFNIPYAKHNSLFFEAVECARKQTPIPHEGDVFLKTMLGALEEYSKKTPLSFLPNSYLQARLFEAKLYIALYTGDNEQIQNILNQIEKKNWDLGHFAMWKVDFTSWLQGLRDKINNRVEFISVIESNKQDKKLLKLPQFELKV